MNVTIKGTHCGSCEVLIERKWRQIPGVEKVRVNHATGEAELTYSCEPALEQLNEPIKAHGYTVETTKEKNEKDSDSFEITRNHVEWGAVLIIVLGAYFLLKRFQLLPDIGVPDTVSYGAAFVLGLVAAVSTCIAVTGSFLMAVASQYNETHPNLTKAQKFKPHIYFNLGRIVSYTVFGALIGAVGSLFALSPRTNGILMIAVSVVMIMLGLQMLKVPLFARIPSFTGFITHRLYDAQANKKHGPFLFGAATFFFPCGFTQALQLYVLAQGSMFLGAGIMLAFVLGTVPALLSVGALTSVAKGNVQHYVKKAAAVIVLFAGVVSLTSGWALTGATITGAAVGAPAFDVPTIPTGEKQVVDMRVQGIDYIPDVLTVKKGVPVEWRIDGSGSSGCTSVIVVPSLGINKRLSRTEPNVITFTPQTAGTIRFTCAMGMAGGSFKVV